MNGVKYILYIHNIESTRTDCRPSSGQATARAGNTEIEASKIHNTAQTIIQTAEIYRQATHITDSIGINCIMSFLLVSGCGCCCCWCCLCSVLAAIGNTYQALWYKSKESEHQQSATKRKERRKTTRNREQQQQQRIEHRN